MIIKQNIPSLLVALMLAVFAFTFFGNASPVASYSISPLAPGATPTPSPQSMSALDFLAQRSGRTTSDFQIMNEYLKSFPLLEREFKAFVVWDKFAGQSIDLLVDLDTGEIIEDIAALEKEEADLSLAKNGKLHPDLLEQLQEGKDSTKLSVGVWVEYDTEEIQKQVLAELAARHPEVQNAIDSGFGPFDIDDDDMVQQLMEEYTVLWYEIIDALVQTLADELRSLGMDVQITASLPSLTVTLSKVEIQELATRSNVQAIHFIESEDGPYAEPRIVGNIPSIFLSGAD